MLTKSHFLFFNSFLKADLVFPRFRTIKITNKQSMYIWSTVTGLGIGNYLYVSFLCSLVFLSLGIDFFLCTPDLRLRRQPKEKSQTVSCALEYLWRTQLGITVSTRTYLRTYSASISAAIFTRYLYVKKMVGNAPCNHWNFHISNHPPACIKAVLIYTEQ